MRTLVDSRSSRVVEFHALLEEFCSLAKQEGLQLTPFHGDGPVFFTELPEPLQQSTLTHFRLYVEAAREVRSQGGRLRNDQLFLWRMFQKLRVHPPSDFMNRLKDGEVIEIHNQDFVQIYRNLHFFSLCSYTLDDLLCRPFWQLYQRDESIAVHLIEIATSLFTGRATGTQPLTIPEHSVLEKDSSGRLLVSVQHRIAAPLATSDGTPVAVVAAVRTTSCVRTAKPETTARGFVLKSR